MIAEADLHLAPGALGERLGLLPHTGSRRQGHGRLSTALPACSCLQLAVATNSPREGLSPSILCPCQAHLITSGRGPAEWRIALGGVLAIMATEAEAAGLGLDVAAGRDPDGHGPGSAVVVVQGDGAEAFACGWIGSVLWVSPSPVRPHHRRKN